MSKIMIVDDDQQITSLLNSLLSLEGFEVTTVNDSSQAMNTARSMNPECFILDLMMPQPNGFELCRMIRNDSTFANTPILIITASDDYSNRAIARAAGANDYLTKPFDHDQLPKIVRSLIKLNKKSS